MSTLRRGFPARHPLRTIRQVVNEALAILDAEFAALHTDFGRPSIAPERLIRASLIQIQVLGAQGGRWWGRRAAPARRR